MWLFTRYGFYSLSFQKGQIVFRARVKQHLEKLLDRFKAEVVAGGRLMPGIVGLVNRDYAWRVTLPSGIAIAIVSAMVDEMTWSNFKDEVDRYQDRDAIGDAYYRTLHQVWSTMLQLQDLEAKMDPSLYNR